MISVKLFALLKERAGRDELQIAAGPATIAELLLTIAREYPALSGLLSQGRVIAALNHDMVKPDARIKDGDEVALMPPFSGGGNAAGQIRIQQEPFSLDEEVDRLKRSSNAIGAIVTFLGTTRDISRGATVSQLHFEHYPGMAEKQLAEIRERAMREQEAIDVTIIHRVGTIPVGENIVLIAAASSHRDEAFKACRFCIDELKRITPIWKRETTKDGEVWVEEHP
jgi:molybdopterin synthase catalytic subunit